MGLPVEQARRYTFEEYLRLEEASVEKHEFRHGEMVSMAGTTYSHSLIAANVIGELRERLKGSSCHVLESNMRARLKPKVFYSYPDLTVICGGPKFDPDDVKQTTITNPRVIIEVLSPSTEAYDRGDKFARYREIESFEEYILIAQHEPSVETFLRQPDGTWSFAFFTGMQATAKIRCLGVELPLAEIYAGVQFEAETPTPLELDPREAQERDGR